MQSDTEADSSLPEEETTNQQSSQFTNFELLSNESGLHTCSPSNSEFNKSDSDSCLTIENSVPFKMALHEGRRLRSALERLTKSEQWYRQELRQQKTIRFKELEKIYSKERKFLKENQKLQKECVQLYDKCFRLEMEIERLRKDLYSRTCHTSDKQYTNENAKDFDVKQTSFTEIDQQLLIDVLRQQKKTLLEDIKNLSESKDEKILELQMLLADLEFDNKKITELCGNLSKELTSLKTLFTQKESEIKEFSNEKIGLQNTLQELRKEYTSQETELRLKEDDSARMQKNFKQKIQSEEDLDEVHRISVRYHEEVLSNAKEIKVLKNQLSCMHHEIEEVQELYTQNEQQQRRIDQLNFLLQSYKAEICEIRQTDVIKRQQIEEMLKANQELSEDKVKLSDEHQKQQRTISQIRQHSNFVNEKLFHVQQQYKEIKFELELLKLDHGKLQFEKDNYYMEICLLRERLTNYMRHIKDFSANIQNPKSDTETTVNENEKCNKDKEDLRNRVSTVKKGSNTEHIYEWLKYFALHFLEFSQECKKFQTNLDLETSLKKNKCDDMGQSSVEEFDRTLSSPEFFSKIKKNFDKVQCLYKDKQGAILSLSTDLENDGKENIRSNTPIFLFLPNTALDNLFLINPEVKNTEGLISTHKEVQCNFENLNLIEQPLEMIEQEQRIQLLQKLLISQQGKTLYLQNNQKDLEELLHSFQYFYEKEEQMKKELELKTRELEELNLIFGKQNEELKRMEEFTIQGFIEHQEKKQLENNFHRKITELEHLLQKTRKDSELYQKQIIEQQSKDKEIEKYKQEISYLSIKLEENERENKERLKHIVLLEKQMKYYKNNQKNGATMNQTFQTGKVDENHLQILTKVLEEEYDRKMNRFSFLSNVNALKKSLKLNQQKTDDLKKNQRINIIDLIEKQRIKTESENSRFEYEKNQQIIEELKEGLTLKREKNENSKLEKCCHNQIDTFEEPNLIDDYKKLIQHSATITKRPTTSEIINLIQRSNQCVPNLYKIESNLTDLQNELQIHLATCAQKMASSTLVNAVNLTVQPSLMDELRVASDSYKIVGS